ncbi:MAG: hypothetical protein CW338_12335, partial [Clostridiales bacterium]|nr:hypothetical protein [Clostridiales bacterium]
GYTVHTCTACGYFYKDSYTDPLGNENEYTVSFSVPEGISIPAAMVCHAGEFITLPTADVPDSYTFIGWVTEDCRNVSELPAVFTDRYTPEGSITLKALYSRTNDDPAGFRLLTSAPDDWEGDYVITYGAAADTMFVLKGITTGKYESGTAGGSAALTDSGLTLTGNTLTGVDSIYVFRIAAADGMFRIHNISTGTYLASRGGYLYSYKTDAVNYCRWMLAMSGDAVDASNAASRSFAHLGFHTRNEYFAVTRSAGNQILFWKLTGGTGSVSYTTIID